MYRRTWTTFHDESFQILKGVMEGLPFFDVRREKSICKEEGLKYYPEIGKEVESEERLNPLTCVKFCKGYISWINTFNVYNTKTNLK